MMKEKYYPGAKFQHAYTKEHLWVLRVGKEQILCRTKDLREIWFYPHELEDVEELKENVRGKRLW